MRTELYSKIIIFVTIIWLTLSLTLTVRSQSAAPYPYIPEPYIPPNSPYNSPPYNSPPYNSPPLNPAFNYVPPNMPQPPQLVPESTNEIVTDNTSRIVINPPSNRANTNRASLFSPFRRNTTRPKSKPSWQQINSRNSFVGRNLYGTEIFGGQIEPTTQSTGNLFTTLETFTYNRSTFISSTIDNTVLKFNVQSLVGAQAIPLQSLPAADIVNSSKQYNLFVQTPETNYMRDEIVAFLGKVANGNAAITDFDVTASGDLIEYAKTYGIDPTRLVFDPVYSKVIFQNPIGGTYDHNNDLKDAQITYNYLAEYKIPYNVGSGGAYGLGRQKVADNMTLVPTNRIIFDYNYFHNIPFTQSTTQIPIQINRFTIGFEKTLLHGLASLEMRIPLAVTINNQLSLFGENDIDKFRLGDITLITKYVLFERRNVIWTSGIGFSLPLAEDISIIDRTSGNDIVRWKNRTLHFMPYLAVSAVPNDRLFFNAVIQGDNAIIGDSTYIADFTQITSKRMISIGKTYDRSYIYTSLVIGYWLRRQEIWNNQNYNTYSFNGQTPNPIYTNQPKYKFPKIPQYSNWAMNFTAELHWTQSISKLRGIYYKQGNYLFDIGNDSSSYHSVDMTLGTRLLFNKKTSLGVGYTVPLSGKDRKFDGELRATYNRYF